MIDLRRLALPLGVIVGVLLVAEAAVRNGIAPMTVAAPSQVLAMVGRQYAVLWFHLEPTLMVADTGLLLALGLSLGVAALVYAIRSAEPVVTLSASLLDSIPMIALAPILATWLGLTLPMRIIIATLICFLPILLALLQGIRAPGESKEELFLSLSATPLQRFRLLALPCALPYLFVGLKIAAPLSMLGALIAESTGAERGLGVFLLGAMNGMRVVELWAGIVVTCTASAGLYLLVCLFERLALPSIDPERAAA